MTANPTQHLFDQLAKIGKQLERHTADVNKQLADIALRLTDVKQRTAAL
jgi:hypothetical protein